ncbi:hypothetical protein B6N60_03667 [Richelia sinica FACHB-800]|uniref:Uncharacterized protein n=1 Tax=Richelia sinica FACHB-800 TaxID=1357546 RepID=A0A975Y666_9NOST|nr:hypothetical protein [Richelia sinica]MBD2664053.1 hypothetical protein [Richelia sinica FACHB-800]QXE24957.1 hypothetical protein B6N60_03667 [Richelia sinica FACHB-800]
MNQKTYSKIASAATFLLTNRATECKDYLEPPFRLAIDILEVMNDGKPYKPCEIAQYLMMQNIDYREKGLNPSTVRQVLQALRAGSVPIVSDRKKGWYIKGQSLT